MEDDLKIWKVEYLSSHWLDLPQILNINSWDRNRVKKGLDENDLQWKTSPNGRWPQNIQSWISQKPLIGSPSNFKHKRSWDQTNVEKGFNEEDLQWKTTFNWRYDFVNRGKPRGNLECGSAQPSLFLVFFSSFLLVRAVAVQAVSCSERSDHYFW